MNHKGTPYRPFRSAFERAVRKAGLEDITGHDLRHTFASRLVMAGIALALEQCGEQVPAMFTTDSVRDSVVLPSIFDFPRVGR